MPAKLVPDSDLGAGIQDRIRQRVETETAPPLSLSLNALSVCSWIPGLALLARNDAAVTLQIFCDEVLGSNAYAINEKQFAHGHLCLCYRVTPDQSAFSASFMGRPCCSMAIGGHGEEHVAQPQLLTARSK